MCATPQATQQQSTSTLHTEPYCTVPNAAPGASLNMLLTDDEAASEVRLGRAREPRDDGMENPFTRLGYPVHPNCGATHLFDFKTQTTRVQYWLAAKLLFKKRLPCVRPGSNPQNEVYTPATTSSTRWSTTQPKITFCRQQYIVP